MQALLFAFCVAILNGQQFADGQYSDGSYVQPAQVSQTSQTSQYAFAASQTSQYSSGYTTATQWPQPAYTTQQRQYDQGSPPGTSSGYTSGGQYGAGSQFGSTQQYGASTRYPQSATGGFSGQGQYGSTQQYGASTRYPQSATGGISGQGQDVFYSGGSGGSGISGSSLSFQQYSSNNGNCQYEDGFIIENGQRRQATAQEVDRISQYKQSLNDYMREVNGYVGDWVSNMFKNLPFNLGQSFPRMPNMPPMPEPPCLCSAETCAQIQQQREAIQRQRDAIQQQIQQQHDAIFGSGTQIGQQTSQYGSGVSYGSTTQYHQAQMQTQQYQQGGVTQGYRRSEK
ncbi:unnamed protein product [Cylicocyclus nassatus]|uniref:CB1 cannabinoid receptor-interacting protein 1 n=1 Tax=Cylicocyclus nassatus TaxID=53992 RepID=A0AA36DQ19_CYLNA|nr:unnamed protein product [Cylicocyclus nassatus]